MGKIAVLIFLAFLTVLGFFAVGNKDAIDIKVPFGDIYQIPKIALILLSTIVGALTVLGTNLYNKFNSVANSVK